jgi:hypothetical protein
MGSARSRERCNECQDTMTEIQCNWCRYWYCSKHSTPHKSSLVCNDCNKELCIEYFDFEISADTNTCYECTAIKSRQQLQAIVYAMLANDTST